MKWFFELGDRYAAKSDWKDFALVKFCLCAMGVLIGVMVPKKYKKPAMAVAAGVFLVTYVPLMVKVFKIGMEMWKEDHKELDEEFEDAITVEEFETEE